MTRIFHRLFLWKWIPCQAVTIRLVFTFPPKDSTLQYKKFVHLWNNFPCIITLRKLEFLARGSSFPFIDKLQMSEIIMAIKELSLCHKLKFCNSLLLNHVPVSPVQPLILCAIQILKIRHRLLNRFSF